MRLSLNLHFPALLVVCGLLAAAPALAAGKKAAETPSQPPAPAAAGQPSAKGERIDEPRQYAHCVALARTKPTEGWEEALAWTGLGGGEPARHCAAIALFGLKQYKEAATRLEELAQSSRRDAVTRAGMLAQAGQSWLLAGEPERAYAAQTGALKLVPGAPDLLVDRAQSLAEARNYREALADLDQALAAAPNRVEALTFRAAAKRFLDDLAGARADIDRAVQLDPAFAEAWLEKGSIDRVSGDDAAARQAWMKVLDLAPEGGTADLARRNIELLDVRNR